MAITKASSSAVAPAAKGDLVAGTTTNDSGVLAVGANGTVLTAASGETTGLQWATPSSGGMTLINSGGTTLSGGSVTIGSIPSTYKDLYLVVRDFLPATDQTDLCVRVNGDSTSSRYFNAYYSTAGNTAGNGRTLDESKLFLSKTQFSTSSNSLAIAVFPDYTNTNTFKTAIVHSVGNYDGTTGVTFTGQIGVYNQTGVISSLQFFVSSGNFTSGTFFLYGVN